MLNKAIELAERHGWFLCRQFDNEANAEVHTRTTAREILADFAGETIYAFVRASAPAARCSAWRAASRRRTPASAWSRPSPTTRRCSAAASAQPRDAHGAAPGQPPAVPAASDAGLEPRLHLQPHREGVRRRPGRRDRAGQRQRRAARWRASWRRAKASSSAPPAARHSRRRSTWRGARRKAANIVCMLPDTGERYLSTPLFDGIEVDMNDAELELSRSTPGYRFDLSRNRRRRPRLRRCARPSRCPRSTHAPRRSSRDVVRDHGVVMFALEWCEFCWAVRKLFARARHRLSKASTSTRSRSSKTTWAARSARCSKTAPAHRPSRRSTSAATHVGGCTDLFDAMRSGPHAASCSDAAGIQYDREARASIPTACCPSGCIRASPRDRPGEGTRS